MAINTVTVTQLKLKNKNVIEKVLEELESFINHFDVEDKNYPAYLIGTQYLM